MRVWGRGYLTVYLSLVMAVMISLCMALIGNARVSVMQLETEIVMQTALDSILAEYHRELFRQYNLFAIDSSYGSSAAGKEQTQMHLKEYLDRNLETGDVALSGILYRDLLGLSAESAQIDGVLLLTDGNGTVFRQRAVEAIRDDLGLAAVENAMGWARTVEEADLLGMDADALMERIEDQIRTDKNASDENRRQAAIREAGERRREEEQNLRESGEEIPEPPEISQEEVSVPTANYDSPVAEIRENAGTGILGFLLEDTENLSKRMIHPEVLVEGRIRDGTLKTGDLSPGDAAEGGEALEKAFFGEYLVRYMGYYGSTTDSDALLYQLEYLIAGRDTDVENLNSVALRLLAIRVGADYLMLQRDSAKKAEAEALGIALATAIFCPESEKLFTELILLGWASMEGRYDVKTLLEGGKIPLLKGGEDWHYSLSGALSGNLWADEEKKPPSEGMSYQDYLLVLLLLTGTEKLTVRAMNLVEANIRITAGNSGFRLDGCIDTLVAGAELSSSFGRRFEIRRRCTYEHA